MALVKNDKTIEINDKHFFKVNEGDSKDIIEEKYFWKLLELNEKKKNLFTIECLLRLSRVLNSLGQKEKSLKRCLKHLEMTKYLFEQSHIRTLDAYEVVGLFKVTLEISKSLNGENHKITLDCYIYLTEEYYNLNEYEKAKESLEYADKTIKQLDNDESLEQAQKKIQSLHEKLSKA